MYFIGFSFASVLPRFFFLMLLLSPLCALSQTRIQNEKFQGTVMDSATTYPIPEVNVWTNHSHTISDADGNFSLFVAGGDTLHFSHISYHELVIRPEGNTRQLKIMIALRPKIRMLAEVKVYLYLSETAFKQKVMETTPVLSREEEIAQINSRIITYFARHLPTYSMNAYDNYIDYMKGPQGVVILSSKPSKGLIRAIKNVMSPNLLSYKRFLTVDSSMRSMRLH